MSRLFARLFRYLTALALALVFWQSLILIFRVPSYILPTAYTVAVELVSRFQFLSGHFATTFYETAVGAIVGISAGVVAGGCLAFFRHARWIGEPYLIALQSFPREALAPLLVVWFGFGYAPKIIMSSLICFCPMAISSVATFSITPREMVDLLRAQGATRSQIFWYIRIPYAIPSLVAALRVALPLAVIGAVIGEFIGGSSGLGYVIATESAHANTALVLAAIVLLALLGTSLTGLVSIVTAIAQRRFVLHLEGV